MTALYYTECAPYKPGDYRAYYSEYTTITTIHTITTVTTGTAFNKFTRHLSTCEIQKEGELVKRKPQVKIFGEIELEVLRSLKH